MHKYGREFSVAVMENRNNCVAERVCRLFLLLDQWLTGSGILRWHTSWCLANHQMNFLTPTCARSLKHMVSPGSRAHKLMRLSPTWIRYFSSSSPGWLWKKVPLGQIHGRWGGTIWGGKRWKGRNTAFDNITRCWKRGRFFGTYEAFFRS